MTDTAQSGRPAASNPPRRVFLRRDSLLVMLAIVAVFLVALAVGTFVFFRNLAYGDLVAARAMIGQPQSESQKLNHLVIDQTARLSSLQAKLNNVQATLNAIMPSADTFNMSPNQSLIVADGHLTIGMIGAPANEGVTLNINGKQQVLAAGQVVSIAADAASNCQVGLQSFDMFKAVLIASCTAAKAP